MDNDERTEAIGPTGAQATAEGLSPAWVAVARNLDILEAELAPLKSTIASTAAEVRRITT
jgi:hypothetical protein